MWERATHQSGSKEEHNDLRSLASPGYTPDQVAEESPIPLPTLSHALQSS
jgi:hypothetical protein